MTTLAEYRLKADAQLAGYRFACKAVTEEIRQRKQYRRQYKATLQARAVLQQLARSVQERAHQQISQVVTHALRSAGWDYDFRLLFEEKRGKTEARPVFIRQGKEFGIHSIGGGVVDVAAFALRIAAILLATPRRRRFLQLDEPFRFVHGEIHRQGVVKLLKQLTEDLKFQLVLATGLDWLKAAGTVVELDVLTLYEPVRNPSPLPAVTQKSRQTRPVVSRKPPSSQNDRTGDPSIPNGTRKKSVRDR